MPCIFCLAVFAMLAGAITTLVLDQMEQRLASVTLAPPERVVDSASVARFDAEVACPPVAGGQGAGRPIPISVTVYKKYKRVRIQVMTHALSRAEAEAVEELVAKALDLDIVDRSDAHDEELVREAFGEEAVENLVAQALGLDIVDRSDAHDEELVREAFGEEAVEADRAAADVEGKARVPRDDPGADGRTRATAPR